MSSVHYNIKIQLLVCATIHSRFSRNSPQTSPNISVAVMWSAVHSPGEYQVKSIAFYVAKKNHSYIKVVEVNNDKINVIQDDSFVEDTELEKYTDYKMIEPSDELFSTSLLAQNIENKNLTKEESKYDYVPNYLRSGI